MKTKSAIIDGEVVVPAADGMTDFAVSRTAMKSSRPSNQLVMFGFDLLYLNGYDLRKAPLVTRKAELAKLLKGSDICLSESFEIDGSDLFHAACGMGLEGVVSKRSDSRYVSHRTDNWLKLTCRQRETLSVVGYAIKESRFDGLIVGRQEGEELIYAGKVDHGFTPGVVTDVRNRLKPLIPKTQAFSRKIKKLNAVWVMPALAAEIEYRAKSAEGKLRHPEFNGFRKDL